MGTRLVVVEDDEIILEFLEMVFATETMEVIRARDGQHGVEATARFEPDAVVCDLHMAGMTGFDVLRHIRSHPSLADTPVVIITADQDPVLKRQCMDQGANAFVLKPFDPDALLDTLRRLTTGRDRPPEPRSRTLAATPRVPD